MNRRTLTLSLVALTAIVLAPSRAQAQGPMAHHHMAEASANVPVDPQTAEMNARVDRLLEILRTTGSLATTVLPKDPNFVAAPQAQTRTFIVVMKTFAFSWDGAAFTNNQTITVNQGDHIIIDASVLTGDRPNPPGHSLNMENYIPQSFPLTAGSPHHMYDFFANQAGDFIFFCGEPNCGTGHGNMFGTFHVNAVAPAPTISALNPTTGPAAGGTVVTITGSNFQNGATVQFGGVASSSVTVNSSTSIAATTPAHATGDLPTLPVAVVVRNPDGSSATLDSGFTYQLLFSVGSISPSFGPTGGGTSITLGGSGFAGVVLTVTVGGIPATNVTLIDDSTIRVRTPPHASGSADVVVTRGTSAVTLTSGFAYVTPGTAPPKRRIGKH